VPETEVFHFRHFIFLIKQFVQPANIQPEVELNAKGSVSWQFHDRPAVHQG
jgi:hypothetical protein